MIKAALRKELIEERSRCSALDICTRSEKICCRFMELFSGYDVFLLYFPMRGEVDTKPLIETLSKLGKEVYLPVINGQTILFRQFEGYSNMRKGAFGIDEPCGEIFHHSKKCVAAVPGVAFDESCHRLGFGKGFYDRYLSQNDDVVKAGLAYEFQIRSSVHHESHDICMDVVITENRVLRNIAHG